MKNPKVVFLSAVILTFSTLFLTGCMENNVDDVDNGGDDFVELPVDNNYVEVQDQQETSQEVLNNDAPTPEFIQCLVDSGIVIYGSKTCPACVSLVNDFGGYDAVGNIFVFCGDEGDRCSAEMQTGYVPEIQLNGKLHEGDRSMQSFSELTGCEL